jgi:hypothetical protein
VVEIKTKTGYCNPDVTEQNTFVAIDYRVIVLILLPAMRFKL